MRKIAVLLTLCLTISLCGCSSGAGQSSNGVSNKDVSDIMSDKADTQQDTQQSGDDILNSDSQNQTNTESAETSQDNVIHTEVNMNDITGEKQNQNNGTEITSNQLLSQICEIRVIDCGQADSILIHSGEYDILVDAGEKRDANAIINVLDNKGIKDIDLLVATHPHADHIGGMETIVEKYDIKNILMSPTGHTSSLYENLLLAIDSKGYTINAANVGDEYRYGDIILTVIGPFTSYDDLNNNSVVMTMSFGDTDVLLTGDAEMQAEKDYVQYVKDIDILKVGHHGSDTSTSDNLLDVANPEVALISCGVNNKFGHPCQETLDKLNDRGIEIFRTDTSGDLIVRTDGINYTIETKEDNQSFSSEEQSGSESKQEINDGNTIGDREDTEPENTETMVYVSKSGKKYHSTENCSRLYTSKQINSITEQEAIQKGLLKCTNCW